MKIELNNEQKLDITVRKNEKNIYEYYIGNVKIGVWDPKSMVDHILLLQNTLDNELSASIKDKINQKDLNEIEKEAQESKEIDTYTKELGLRDVKRVTKLELEKEIDTEKSDEQNKEKRQEKKEGKKEIEKTTEKDVNVKQELQLDERADEMHDIKRWLDGKVPNEISKIGVIESEELGRMKDENGESYDRNSTRYSLIAISKDGTVEPLSKYIPELKQRDASGDNPREEKWQVRDDGKVEKEAILSEYEIGNKIIQIDNKETGRVEVNLGRQKQTSTETMGVQAIDSNTPEVSSTKVRDTVGYYNENGMYTVDRNIDEAEQHAKSHSDCEEMEEKDIDGDWSSNSQHVDNQINEKVTQILEDDSNNISSVYNFEDVKSRIQEKMKADSSLTLDEAAEKTEEELAENAKEEHDMPQHRL